MAGEVLRIFGGSLHACRGSNGLLEVYLSSFFCEKGQRVVIYGVL